jgi:molecular chaperone DnaK
MSDEVTIGIDLGTSNSCVAAVVDGQPRVLANAAGERTTASVVAFHADGSIVVGNRAKAEVILDPRHTVSSAKRLIGRYFFSEEVRKARAVYRYEIVAGENHSVRIRVREEEFSLPEISAFVLKEMKQTAEHALGREVTRAVITVPAYFNDSQRQATKDAGRIAGLDVMRILNEPTAAALAYGYGRQLNQRVVIYDLGGGTFDVSVLEIGADVFEVRSTCGDTYLGGDDFDDRLIDLLADRVQAESGVNVRSEPQAFEQLKAAAEAAKIALSERDQVRISLPDLARGANGSIGVDYELTRAEFDKLTRDLVQRTFKVCDEALQQAGVSPRELDGVILVGGPTRLSSIRASVKGYFQRDPETGINPDEVVAMGAAIHAHSLVSQSKSAYLFDVTPLSLRIGIAGGLTHPIIERNTPIPIDHTRVFTTAKDHQESISVRVYQGEARAAAENSLLAEFEFSEFEPGKRGDVQIEVTFAIDTEGIVSVKARDRKTGAEAQTTVSMSSGLSKQQIDEIVARSRTSDVAAPAAAAGSDASLEDDDEMLIDIPDLEKSVKEALSGEGNRELFGARDTDLSEDDQAPIPLDEPNFDLAARSRQAPPADDRELLLGNDVELVLDDDEEVKLGDED